MTRVGVDLGGTKLLVRIASAAEVITERMPTSPAFGPTDLAAALRRLLHSADPRRTTIGIAVPGLVGDHQTVIACDVLPRFVGWSPVGLRELAARTWIVNDAQAALLEETRELEVASGGLVMVGTRIGAAFMSGGRIVDGARGWAGELGYLPVVLEGRLTTLDRVAPGEALTSRLAISGEQVRARLEAGDPTVRDAVAEAGWWLGLGLASVINLLNPELLVVGGGTTRLPGYLEAALRSAEAATLPQPWSCCTIRKARAGDHVVARGAALEPGQAIP